MNIIKFRHDSDKTTCLFTIPWRSFSSLRGLPNKGMINSDKVEQTCRCGKFGNTQYN